MNRKLILLIIPILLLFSCSEFIEPELKQEQTELLAPKNGLESTTYLQTFWWEYAKGASYYQLQVVEPSFAAPARLVLDTIIHLNKFSFTLAPGKYQWRVNAMNSTSQGPFSTRSLTIHPSSIKEQQLLPETPADGHITNQSPLNFRWPNLYGATEYELQIDANGFADPNNPGTTIKTSNLATNYVLTNEGSYQWRIRAINATESSKWSAIRKFVYDKTAPAKPQLSSPSNNQIVQSPVRLQWNSITDAKNYELIIYRSDGTTPFSANFPMQLTEASYNFSQGATGEKYFWKVSAIDKAGNKSEASESYSFTIQ